jgi:hypothetical protein
LRAQRIFTIRNIIAVILAGALGQIIGEVLKYFFPPSNAREAVLYTVKVGIEEIDIDLIVFEMNFGFMLKLNLLTFILIFLTIYILQKI